MSVKDWVVSAVSSAHRAPELAPVRGALPPLSASGFGTPPPPPPPPALETGQYLSAQWAVLRSCTSGSREDLRQDQGLY